MFGFLSSTCAKGRKLVICPISAKQDNHPTKMEILEKLFGSAAKVRIIKLFLFHPNTAFDIATITKRTKVARTTARRELNLLDKISFLKNKTLYKDSFKIRRGKRVPAKTKIAGWQLNEKFIYLKELQNFLMNINPLKHREIMNKINRGGKIQMVIVSGVFIQEEESRIDLLIVGESLKLGILESVIKAIEAEVGKELRYVVLERQEFEYRLRMFDKLIRDIFDYNNEVVVDKLGITTSE